MNTATFRSIIPTRSHFNEPVSANAIVSQWDGKPDWVFLRMLAGIGTKFFKWQEEYIIWAAHMTDLANKATDLYPYKMPQT
jgi:hypothetical protein